MQEFDVGKLMNPEQVSAALNRVTPASVESSLGKIRLEEQDLINLLSPAAELYLEKMAQLAQAKTRQRFGRIMKMYAPIYLSSECVNACVYCGFSQKHRIVRKTLALSEVKEQAAFLAARGFHNVLLVSGESRLHVPVEFIRQCLVELRPRFPEISIEVYPLETEEYQTLLAAGLYGMAVYQETYWPDIYQRVHPAGKKRDFNFRLQTPARAAQAGLRQVSLGVLLGLADFRVDAFYLGLHARCLEKQYWRTVVGMSFPRIRAAEGGFQPEHPVTDSQFVQLVTALRLFAPDAPFSLSTREPESLRRHLIHLGFTQMSAESSTIPGGYGQPLGEGAQFSVEDTRKASEVARELAGAGFEPVWKDWDAGF